MRYEIFGENFPAIKFVLDEGEELFTQSGALAWKDKDIEMSTNAEGGLLKSIGRAFSGASLMFVTHRATENNQEITFAASFPGSIKVFKIDENHEYLAQKSAFLVAQKGVDVDATVNKNGLAGLFGGEGFILQKYTGNGLLVAEIDGYCEEVDLKEGQTIMVDTGNIALFESTVSYEIEKVKGLKNIFFGGEGLFMTKLTGPGKVYLQTLTAQEMAKRLDPYITKTVTTTSSSSSSSDK